MMPTLTARSVLCRTTLTRPSATLSPAERGIRIQNLRCQPGLADDGARGADGSSFLGCGTMAIRPAAFLYLAWLPRWVTKKKPRSWSTRMTSVEPSRLGIHQLLADANVRDSDEQWRGFALKVKLNGLLEVCDGFLARGAETGHIHIEALRDVKLILSPSRARICRRITRSTTATISVASRRNDDRLCRHVLFSRAV
jgi:hypothetical protein